MNFDLFLVLVTAVYLSQLFLFMRGVSKPRDERANTSRPFVSVIIAARNEESNLAECLEALVAQSYPPSKFEVLIVNDNSTDRTQSICNEFQQRHSHFRSLSASEMHSFPGKTGPLIQGIEASIGEIILITDADCTVPRTWIESTVLRYTPDVGIVGGMTLQRAKTAFEGMQSLDWAYLLGVASAAVSLRSPLSTIGNNLSFRRAAYDSVGGYRTLPFSITEDYALFQAIVRSSKWDYFYPVDPELLVISKPCKRMIELVRQKHRWAKGGLDMRIAGFLIMAIGFLLHGSIVAAFLTGAFFTGSATLMCKCAGDYFFLAKILRSLKRTEDLRYFYWFELYFSLYVLFLPFLVFFGGKVVWKERSY